MGLFLAGKATPGHTVWNRDLLIDDQGRIWSPATSDAVPLDARLELHESKRTSMNFIVPADASHLNALIEEGPWITNLLFPENQPVFKLR